MNNLPANLFKNHSEIKHLYENLSKVGDNHNDESIKKATETIHSWLKDNGYPCDLFAISLQDTKPDIHHIRYLSYNEDIGYAKNLQDMILPWFSSETSEDLLHIEKIELAAFIEKLGKINSIHIDNSEKRKSCGDYFKVKLRNN